MNSKNKIIIAVSGILISAILYSAYIKYKNNKNINVTNDVDFKALLQKIDKAPK